MGGERRPRIAYSLRPARASGPAADRRVASGGPGEGMEIAPRVSYVARHVIARLRAARASVNRSGQPQALLAQEAVPSSGEDLKVYVAGDWVAAITRPYPVVTEQDRRGRPAKVPPKVREVALASGKALGLELYGVDFLV